MKVLIAVDRTEYAEIVLEHGIERLVQDPEAELHVLTVIDADADAEGVHRWLDRTVREALDNFGIAGRSYTAHVVLGSPLDTIAVLASRLGADLLVIGRFDVPSVSDDIADVVDCPTLIVGIDGVVSEPQCPQCRDVRRASDGARLFCERHAGDRIPDLLSRLPIGSLVYRGGIW
jgi:nucleotide-binding universal stress UspA family protein